MGKLSLEFHCDVNLCCSLREKRGVGERKGRGEWEEEQKNEAGSEKMSKYREEMKEL
jgi:hypothetical protein